MAHPEEWMNDYYGWKDWTEDLRNYEYGIFLAVKIDDVFNDRYEVRDKLGQGGNAQVWLAKDRKPGGHGYVALKINRPKNNEAFFLNHLAEHQHTHPGSKHVIKLLDRFTIYTENGSYDGLALEIVGLSLFAMCGKLSVSKANLVAKQVAMGLAFMHHNGVAHGDLFTNNVCFAIPGLNDQMLSQLGAPVFNCIYRTDGKPLPPLLPKYVVKPKFLPRVDGDIKIIDLGEAFFFDKKPHTIQTAPIYMSPELLLYLDSPDFDHRIDLWTLGCLIYEVFIGEHLLRNKSRSLLLFEMTRMIQYMPRDWQWKVNIEKFLNSDGTPKEAYKDLPSLDVKLARHAERRGDPMTFTEYSQLYFLLKRLLTVESWKRLSAEEVVRYFERL